MTDPSCPDESVSMNGHESRGKGSWAVRKIGRCDVFVKIEANASLYWSSRVLPFRIGVKSCYPTGIVARKTIQGISHKAAPCFVLEIKNGGPG